MASGMSCLREMAGDVLTQTENLHRQAGALRKWSKSLLKRTSKTVGTGETNSLELLSQDEEQELLSELREHRHELEMKNDELRWVKEELEVSLEQYFDLYDLAPVGYFILSKKGLILKANLTVATQLGVKKEALVKQPIASFILCDEQDIYSQQYRQFLTTGKGAPRVTELKMLRAGAAPFWARLETTVAQGVDGEPIFRVVMTDISDGKRVEEELRESKEKYRMVADFTFDWEFWLGPDDSIIYCSPSCEKITGHSVAEFEYDPALLRRIVHPEDLAIFDQHRHGVKSLKIHEEIEFRIIHTDGSIRWISHVCRPVFNAGGQCLGTRGSNRDITEHKDMEAEVLKIRNLEALGGLASGIAHDFNNLIQELLGNISLAKRYSPESSEAFQFLEKAENAYAQAAKLTNKLIAFSTVGRPRRVELQRSKSIRDAVTPKLSGSDAIASGKTAIKKDSAGNGPRILIMDDEAAVTEVATKYLSLYGYRVDSAASGDAAVAAYQEACEADAPYAAVILDLMIPGGMGGKEVFSILKATDPEVKAIVSSGYADDPAMIDFAAHGFVEVLVKPYQLNDMKKVLDRLV